MSLEKTFTVLVCDDDYEIRVVTHIILERIGYRVVSCETSDKVFKLIHEENPDIILMDILLPGMTGDEVTKHLKYHTATKEIPIILFSASKLGEMKAKNAGADAFLNKPFDISEMEHLVSTLLIRQSQNRSFS